MAKNPFAGVTSSAKRMNEVEITPEVIAETMLLDEIIDRASEDTRPLDIEHIVDLAESIGTVGLIHSIPVDFKGRLLAGGHRKAALFRLRENNPEIFKLHFPEGKIPVRRLDFDATIEPQRALEIETTENEKRKDYTPAQVRAIADKLIQSGYKFTKGRPRKGEKALRPALEVIIGKSGRTVQRYLESGEVTSSPSKNTTSVVFLKQALQKLEKWEASPTSGQASESLQAKLPDLKKAISLAISEISKD